MSTVTPRADLSPAVYSTVDAALKQLQIAAKRTKRLVATLAEEQAVLDRLYYKGNNQHRAALFWRRVADLRRNTRRVIDIPVHERITTLAHAFHVDGFVCCDLLHTTLKLVLAHPLDLPGLRYQTYLLLSLFDVKLIRQPES
jgi:hypothetical protein